MIGNTRSIPIVCFSVQNQAKKKRNLQTGYIEQMIDFEWTMIVKYKKQKKNMICTKKKKRKKTKTQLR